MTWCLRRLWAKPPFNFFRFSRETLLQVAALQRRALRQGLRVSLSDTGEKTKFIDGKAQPPPPSPDLTSRLGGAHPERSEALLDPTETLQVPEADRADLAGAGARVQLTTLSKFPPQMFFSVARKPHFAAARWLALPLVSACCNGTPVEQSKDHFLFLTQYLI